MSRFQGPVLFEKTHDYLEFDCGTEPLNTFLVRHPLANHANDSARTFVGLAGNRIVGYYSLSGSAVLHEEAPERMATGLARNSAPILLMARFAVNKEYQGQGIATGLLKDALKRCLRVSREVGIRAFMVHAKDDEARGLYQRYGMLECPVNPFHLYFLMKDVEKFLGPG